MKILTTAFFLLFSLNLFAQTAISDFLSVEPAAQSDTFIIPDSHRFQKIIEKGDLLSDGNLLPSKTDFTGYVPINGSSTNGYLSINSENAPGDVTIMDVQYDPVTKLWSHANSELVDFDSVNGTAANCSGTVTPWNTIITCEEFRLNFDFNGDGYNDLGWAIEIDPVTRTVVNDQKLWALGNFAHENAVIHSNNRTLYQGVDANPGYLYKFIADNPQDLSSGRLLVYVGSKNGPGVWEELDNTTPQERNSTLAQSELVGATVFAGIEDVEIGPDGMVYFAVKSEKRVFRFLDSDPITGTTVLNMETYVGRMSYEITHENGVTLQDWGGGNDNLAFDGDGNLWVMQDGGTNFIWVVENGHTQAAPKVKIFGVAPTGSEPTGITFSPDFKFMFMSIMHPSSGNNTSTQTDAAGNQIAFDKDISIVVSLRGNLGECAIDGITSFDNNAWTNGTPDRNRDVVFAEDYNTSTANIEACSCEIATDANVTVAADGFINVDEDIIVNPGGSLTVAHTGSVLQRQDNAVVTNNGEITVFVSTPILDDRDFMIMGSPMSEADHLSFTDARRVIKHISENFEVYEPTPPEPEIIGVNFYDQDNNDFENFTGILNPAEGYLIKHRVVGTQSFDYVFDQGTLNTGVITYDAFFGIDKEDSPNLLANPYPSAIDASAFIAANDMVDEVYFWEHLTAPAVGIPGPRARNYSMEDISTYNGTMGIPAANDEGTSTTPNGIIATGQGFGIKANAAGTVVFNNSMRVATGNTTLRRPDENSSAHSNKDLLWLQVRAHEYGMGSTTGIGFMSNATSELDEGFDTEKLGTVVSLYSHLADGSGQFGIQGREAFNESIVIPVGFSTQLEAPLTYTISLAATEGVNLSNSKVYLVDHLEQNITNLSEETYQFTSTKGQFDARFELQFQPTTLGIVQSDLELISIYPNPSEDTITIVSPRSEITQITIYDIGGRTVLSEEINSEKRHMVDISTFKSAVYFVKITSETGSLTKKILKR